MPTNFKGGLAADFQNSGIRNLNEYIDLYKNYSDKICGDISNDYFYYYEASIVKIKKIYRDFEVPEPRIIILLRNPIDRIYSLYHHTIRLGSDDLDFKAAFDCSDFRIKSNYSWTYDIKGNGFTFPAVNAFKSNFANVKIFLTEDLKNSNFESEFCKLFNIISTNDSKIMFSNINNYIQPRFYFLNHLLNGGLLTTVWPFRIILRLAPMKFKKFVKSYLNRINYKNKQYLDESTRSKLYSIYKDDIIKLSRIIDQDISHWHI